MFCKVERHLHAGSRCGFAKSRAAIGQERILVNCAGVGGSVKTVSRDKQTREIKEYPLDNFERIIQINLIGTFRCITKSAAGMLTLDPLPDGDRGAIVNTASVAAEDGQIGQAAYTASKAGIVGITLTVARDLVQRRHPLQHHPARHLRHAAAGARAGEREGGAGGAGAVPAPARPAGRVCAARAHHDHQRLLQRRGRAPRRRHPHGAALNNKIGERP